ncbi:MAG: hypothetical protein C0506_06870 [Anaerolinea sp.]|nr:hypothetical protein [Anaerolinea sp.]
MTWFPCPYLGRPVELTGEREHHIESAHPDLLPANPSRLEETIALPDYVGSREARTEIGFVRFWPDLLGGRWVVVVVVGDRDGLSGTLRYWIVTAYVARQTRTWRPVWEPN